MLCNLHCIALPTTTLPIDMSADSHRTLSSISFWIYFMMVSGWYTVVVCCSFDKDVKAFVAFWWKRFVLTLSRPNIPGKSHILGKFNTITLKMEIILRMMMTGLWCWWYYQHVTELVRGGWGPVGQVCQLFLNKISSLALPQTIIVVMVMMKFYWKIRGCDLLYSVFRVGEISLKIAVISQENIWNNWIWYKPTDPLH